LIGLANPNSAEGKGVEREVVATPINGDVSFSSAELELTSLTVDVFLWSPGWSSERNLFGLNSGGRVKEGGVDAGRGGIGGGGNGFEGKMSSW
jgi:hypothetical protein